MDLLRFITCGSVDDGKSTLIGRLLFETKLIFEDQLEALKQNDSETPPTNWKLSPRSVLAYIIGGKPLKATIRGKSTEVAITRKFFGDDGVVERAIVTLASERSRLLVG